MEVGIYWLWELVVYGLLNPYIQPVYKIEMSLTNIMSMSFSTPELDMKQVFTVYYD
jgi:hypothetical protein